MTPREVITRATDPGAWSDCDDYPTARHARPKDLEYARRRADAILAALTAAGFAVVPRAALESIALRCRPSPLDTDADRMHDLRHIGKRVRLMTAAEGETR